ncbi:MAG: energy transducer TonB [Vicinamibacterales bacterium]
MQEAVSGILNDRAREAEGLSRMFAVSLGIHIILLGGIWLMPASWRTDEQGPRDVMTISLGGPEGPDTGGMTSMADRAIQEVAKPTAPKAIETPPAAKRPEMVEPERTAKPTPPKPVKKPDERSTTRAPSTGAEIKTGSAKVTTGGAAIPFGGLAQGGGGAGGVTVNVQNFCCPAYLTQMIQMIRRNWNQKQGAAGQSIVKFTIRRDGMLTNVELTQSSGQALLDLEARRAVHNTQQLPPLPREFTEPSLTIHLTFDYQR